MCFGASAVSGGEKRSIPRALKTLAQMPRFKPVQMMSDSKSVIGLNMLRLLDSRGSLDEFVEPLRKWTESGELRPVVVKAFPIEQAPDAHRFIQERKNVGKVVLTL